MMNIKNIEATATDIVDSAITVHRALGPGLLESAYQTCLAFELQKRGRKILTTDLPSPISTIDSSHQNTLRVLPFFAVNFLHLTSDLMICPHPYP
jgi:hypothetical protein